MATLEEITRITDNVFGGTAQPTRQPEQGNLDSMVGDIFAGVSTQGPLGIAPEKPERLTFVESAKEIGKGLLRMPERMLAQSGNVMEWMADYRPEKSWLPAQRVIGMIQKKLQPAWHSRMEEANRDVMRKYGEDVSKKWTLAAETGIEAKSEKFKKQTWASAFVTKALTGAFESSGSFLAALGVGYITKNPQLGILMLSTMSGGSAFKAQKEKGTDLDIAQNIGLMTAAWEGLTEQIPFHVILNPSSKSALKRFLKGGTVEGFQEFIQGIGENYFEHLGYNLKDWKSIPDATKAALPHLLDNWLDNVTAGFLMGGGASAVIRTRANEIVETNPELAEKIASKEKPSRTDVEALGIQMNAQERQELSGALKTALEETKQTVKIDEKPPVRPVELTKEQVPVEAPTGEVAAEKPTESVEGEVEAKPEKPEKIEPRPQEQITTEQTPKIQSDVAEAAIIDVTDPAFPTSTKHDSTKEIRDRLGLGKVNSKERRSDEQAMAEAIKRKIPQKAARIADEINAGGTERILSDIEDAGMRIALAELEIEHEQLMDLIGKEKDGATTKTLSVEAERVENELSSLIKAIETSGSEAGRALRARRVRIGRDFKLTSVLNRAKAAAGKEISKAKRKIFETLTKQLGTATKQVETLEKEVRELQANSLLKRGAKRFTSQTTTQRQSNISSLAADINELLLKGCGN